MHLNWIIRARSSVAKSKYAAPRRRLADLHKLNLLVSQGRHSPNISTILLRLFYDFSTIIPRAHFPAFPRKILVSRSKKNPSTNLASTKFFYNFSTKLP
jgi:hypothetical protein